MMVARVFENTWCHMLNSEIQSMASKVVVSRLALQHQHRSQATWHCHNVLVELKAQLTAEDEHLIRRNL